MNNNNEQLSNEILNNKLRFIRISYNELQDSHPNKHKFLDEMNKVQSEINKRNELQRGGILQSNLNLDDYENLFINNNTNNNNNNNNNNTNYVPQLAINANNLDTRAPAAGPDGKRNKKLTLKKLAKKHNKKGKRKIRRTKKSRKMKGRGLFNKTKKKEPKQYFPEDFMKDIKPRKTKGRIINYTNINPGNSIGWQERW